MKHEVSTSRGPVQDIVSLIRLLISVFGLLSLSCLILPKGMVAGNYNRDAAYNYAWTHYSYETRWCDHGYNYDSVGGDCCHFVSHCLGAGGLDVYNQGGGGHSGIIIQSQQLYSWLLDGRAQQVGSWTSLDKGDVVLYDWGTGPRKWDHTALYIGNGKIASHSSYLWEAPVNQGEVDAAYMHIIGGTDCPVPDSPSLVSPGDNSIVNSLTVTFNWNPSSTSEVDVYTIRFVDDQSKIDSGPWIRDHGVDAPTTSSTETFDRDDDFWWAVWACTCCTTGNPTYSQRAGPWKFTIDTSGPPPCNPNADQVALYADINYGGNCVTLDVGQYPNPGHLGNLGNDNAESIKVGSNVKATLYEHDNYEGGSEEFGSDDSNLADNAIGINRVSSVKVQWPEQLPDLRPYILSGYPYPVVPSSIVDTHQVNTLFAHPDSYTYFDWHFINSEDGTASGDFSVELWVDDTRYVRYTYSNWGSGWVGGFDDWAEHITESGWHTVRLVTDPDNTIAESDETNNVWERQFYWEPVAGWLGRYYNNETLSGGPALVRDDAEIDFDWQADPPGSGVNSDHFSVRWDRTVHFDSGTYGFHVFRDDGARLWVDNVLVLDEWAHGREWDTTEQTLSAGDHKIRLEMYEIDGWASAKLYWESTDTEPPSGRMISPSDGSATNTCPVTISAEANDTQSGVAWVKFWVWYDGSWHEIYTDTDGSDGWNASWDCSGIADQQVIFTIWL